MVKDYKRMWNNLKYRCRCQANLIVDESVIINSDGFLAAVGSKITLNTMGDIEKNTEGTID